MEENNIISIREMMDFIYFYRQKLESKKNSSLEEEKDRAIEKKLQPLKKKVEQLEIINDVDEAITIIDKMQNADVLMEIETTKGTNTYFQTNDCITKEEEIIPSLHHAEIAANEQVAMTLDHDQTIHKQIIKTLQDIELFMNYSFLHIKTTDPMILFKFNLEQQFLVFKNKEKPIQEFKKQEIKDLGVFLEDIPAEMMLYYHNFIEHKEEKGVGKVQRLLKKLGNFS